eukprot:scpid92170/ scgid5266/ 
MESIQLVRVDAKLPAQGVREEVPMNNVNSLRAVSCWNAFQKGQARFGFARTTADCCRQVEYFVSACTSSQVLAGGKATVPGSTTSISVLFSFWTCILFMEIHFCVLVQVFSSEDDGWSCPGDKQQYSAAQLPRRWI